MKKLFTLVFLSGLYCLSAQTYQQNWHLQYNSKDTNYGIGLLEAVKSYPIPTNAKKVIVAVIDDGVDINHPDLKDNIWTNPKEIPDNAVDDDHNGYIDDMHGWDYLGSLAADIEFDNLELTRLLRDYKLQFENRAPGSLSKKEKADYKSYKKLNEAYNKELKKAEEELKILQLYNKFTSAFLEELDSSNISYNDMVKKEPKSVDAKYGYAIMVDVCKRTGLSPKKIFDGLREDYEHANEKINYHLNLDYDSRSIVGDNYRDPKSMGYGNQDVLGPDGTHGTHVSGIIGAGSNNGLGMDGICPLIQIMALRVVPNGDERDKDVALAIRYAADNGAKVINMSFGKYYSYNSAIVQDAIRYAESKDVLMVHAAGNESGNNDKSEHYPTAVYMKDSVCKTWIEVGASDRNQNPASFSNYGKSSVNVFAPGVQIYSTVINRSYKALDGTSMASPVVAGLAALIRAYYPQLTAIQVKQIIESSVVKPEQKVKKPGKKRKKTKYKKLCSSGGIVNAGNALKAAALVK